MRGAVWLRIVLVLLVLLAGAAAGAYALRQTIATFVITRYFAAYNLVPAFRIERLTVDGLEVTDIAVADLKIRRLALSYSLSELSAGVIRRADIDGLSMTLNLTGEGPLLAELQPFLETEDEGPGLEKLPAVTLRDATLNLRLPRETLAVDLSGTITPGIGQAAALVFDFSGTSDRLAAMGRGNLGFDGVIPVSADVQAEISQRAGGFRFALRSDSDTIVEARPTLRLELSGDGALAALAEELPQAAAFRPDGGNFRLSLNGTFLVPRDPGAWPQEFEAGASLDVALESATLAAPALDPSLQSVTGGFGARFAYKSGHIEGAFETGLEAASGIKVNLAVPSADATLDNDFAVQNVTLNDLTARLQAYPIPIGIVRDLQLRGALAGRPDALSGNLRATTLVGNVDMGGTRADEVRVEALLNVVSRGFGFSARGVEPASMRIATLAPPMLLPLRDLAAQADAVRLEFAIENGVWIIRHSSSLRVPEFDIRVQRQEGAPVPFAVTAGPVDFALLLRADAVPRITASMDIVSATMPEAGIALRGARLSFTGDPVTALDGTLEGGAVTQEIASPAIVPLTPKLVMTKRGNALEVKGTLTGSDGALALGVEGHHDIATSLGAVIVTVGEVVLGPGGADGARISPLLAGIEGLRGRVQGEGGIEWSPDGLSSTGQIVVDEMSFRREGMEVEGMKLSLALDSLAPMRSLPEQHTTVRKLVAAAELTNIDITYRFEQSANGDLRFYPGRFSANALGGRIGTNGGTVDPLRGEASLVVNAEDLSLAMLLQAIGRPEIKGDGRLSGTLPIVINSSSFAISGGALGAAGAGVIQFSSDDARGALASGGEPVKLMLDAIEDFHYEVLDMTLDKPAAGDTKILLRLQGSNPAVLDGQVFHLNVTLTGNADPLLNALSEGQRLRDALITPLTTGTGQTGAPAPAR